MVGGKDKKIEKKKQGGEHQQSFEEKRKKRTEKSRTFFKRFPHKKSNNLDDGHGKNKNK